MHAAPRGVRRLVGTVALLGVVSTAALSAAAPATDAAPSLVVVVGLLLLTTLGEATAVRLRHGQTVEELTLFEAAVVIDALLLPPATAVLVSVIALAIACAVRRRPLLKSAYNVGSHATSTVLLVSVFHLLGVPAAPTSPRSVAALVIGVLAFAAVNLTTLARVLSLVEGVRARTVIAEGLRLSALMAFGNVAVGSVTVALAHHAPALLPFSVLPALALTVAYRSAAQEAEEVERSERVLELTASLARRLDADEHLAGFLGAVRRVFRVTQARVVMVADPHGQPVVYLADDTGVSIQPAAAADLALLALADIGSAPGVVLAPLDADGLRLGVLSMPCAQPKHAHRDLRLLTPLASALAVGLRSAAHLAELEAERSKLRAVVDHSSDGMLVLDEQGGVLVWNPAMAALTGVPEADAHGRPLADLLVTTAEGAAVVPLAEVLPILTADAPRATREHGVVRVDGEHRHVVCSHSGIFGDDGTQLRDVVVVRDVSRERQVERLKADFVATVSHELRTPLTPIKGYVDLLRRKISTMPEEKRNACLDVVADRVGHLSRLVEDLLLASKISGSTDARRDVTLSPQELTALVRRAAGDFAAHAARIGLDLPAAAVHVACDPTRTIQVVGNLLSNAIKYAPEGSAVEVSLQVDGGWARLAVRDRGRGIPADQLERIFDKFVRVEDPMTMTTGGTGLGLFISRELLTAMNGDIAVRSTLGEGSTFEISLPVCPAPVAASVPSPRAADAAARQAAAAARRAMSGR